MSARASRLRLEEKLRNIVDQEARLDEEINALLQTKADGEEKYGSLELANGNTGSVIAATLTATAPVGTAERSDGGSLEQSLAELSRTMPDFPLLEEKAGALVAQIEDGHGTAERVSSSVRRLDDIQMKVQRALALVEDVINLRGCADGVLKAVDAGDFGKAATYVRRFREIDAGALADSGEMMEMEEAVKGLSLAVLERFQTAVLEMDEPGIAATCPLLAPLGLATQGQELYLGFARRALEAELQAGVNGDEASPATQRLPEIYNVAAAFLRRQVPVAAAGLAPCLGDVALVRVVTKECGDRAAAVLERHLREKNVATWAARGVSSLTEGVIGEGAEGSAATAKMLGQVDALLDELALMTQHTESYDRFVRFLVEEVENAHPSEEEGVMTEAVGVGGQHSVVPAPILEPIMPTRTRLQEAAAEVAMYYSQIEGQLLKASVAKAIAVDEISPGSTTSSCAEDSFFVAQRCSKRGLATAHAGAASAVVNHAANTLGEILLQSLVRKVKSSLGTLPAGGGSTLDLTIKQLGQIDFTDLKSLKDQLQIENWEGMGAGLASDFTSSATAAISTIARVQGVSSSSVGGGAVGLGNLTGGGTGGGGSGDGISGGVGGDGKSNIASGGLAAGRGGGVGEGSGAAHGVNQCLVFINTLEACSGFVVRLRELLDRDASAAFGGVGHDAERVISCLQELGSTGALFSRAASDCLEEVLNRLRRVFRTVVSSHLGEKSPVSYQLNENQYAANEAEDPFAHALVEYLRLLFEPYRPPVGLTESLFAELLTLVAGYLAKLLELALKRRFFTQLGALQLDKDLRCVMGFFTQQAGRGAREPFSRLVQVSLLLNLERPQDAADYWEPGSSLQAQLTADEVVSVLHQREDFLREDLGLLELPEAYIS